MKGRDGLGGGGAGDRAGGDMIRTQLLRFPGPPPRPRGGRGRAPTPTPAAVSHYFPFSCSSGLLPRLIRSVQSSPVRRERFQDPPTSPILTCRIPLQSDGVAFVYNLPTTSGMPKITCALLTDLNINPMKIYCHVV